MCYNVVSSTRKKLKYAKHRHDDQAYIEELERELKLLDPLTPANYQVSGFAHPNLIVFTNDKPFKPQAFQWGLIPSWTKDAASAAVTANHTINARSETIFEKPSFRTAANKQRCLIYIDGFYEHHHHKGKTYPFHISMADDSPVVLAGLWDEWTDKNTGEIKKTVTIVTCVGNNTMTKIHNNPKADGPRMPVILSRENQDKWLMEINATNTKENIMQLAIPFPDEALKYYTVRKILGKNTLGNVPETENEFHYDELHLTL